MRTAFTPLLALMMAACATTGATEPDYQERDAGEGYVCDASGLQDHIGHKASAKSGEILLKLSGARVLRWVPPDTYVTLDYRADRLTVGYDEEMVITRISCG